MNKEPEKILDRRKAIRRGLGIAQSYPEPRDVVVLISGMGVDTEITDGEGAIVPWSDIEVTREELTHRQV